jgi:hypothetical protein
MSRKSTSFQRTVDAAFDIEGSRVRCEIAANQGGEDRLTAFLAASPEQRAAMWRLADAAQRRDLVARQGMRLGADVCNSWIDAMVAKCDAHYGDAPTATEAAVVGALEAQEARFAVEAIHAYGSGQDGAGKFFSRERNAAAKALANYRVGIRPELTDDDAWRVASASSSAVYTVSRGGQCGCKAGANGQPCWHVALVAGLETGLDDLAAFDDDAGDDAPALTDLDRARVLDADDYYDMAA